MNDKQHLNFRLTGIDMNNNLIDVQKIGSICTLTISRQEALNALNMDVLKALSTAVDDIERDASIRVLLLTGAGKAFVAGADIAEMQALSPAEARAFAELGSRVFRKIELLNKTVIAVVNGFALGGGCELAMAADIRLASQKAKFGQPEVGLGIIPGFSGTQRLPRLVGVAKAKELIYTGVIIGAEEAKTIGLVNQVCDHETLMECAVEMATSICANSPVAVTFAKTAIDKGLDQHIEVGIEIEKDLFALCFSESDQNEGMQAFLEKRKPKYN
jgi:enoyl-CoA hydratase